MEKHNLKLETSWDDVKENLKENNINLTDEDLDYVEGREDELLIRLSHKLGKSPGEIKALIESISHNKRLAS